MQSDPRASYAIAKSILIVAVVLLVLEIGVAVAVHYLGIALPNSFGVVTMVVSTMAGAQWFRRSLSRAMSKTERLGFATGVTVVNALIPVAFMAVLLVFAGLPVTPKSFDLVIAGGRGDLFQPFVAWLVFIILALIFLQAYFVGWFSTRDRVRRTSTPAR